MGGARAGRAPLDPPMGIDLLFSPRHAFTPWIPRSLMKSRICWKQKHYYHMQMNPRNVILTSLVCKQKVTCPNMNQN